MCYLITTLFFSVSVVRVSRESLNINEKRPWKEANTEVISLLSIAPFQQTHTHT
jgi:hypothetical protein